MFTPPTTYKSPALPLPSHSTAVLSSTTSCSVEDNGFTQFGATGSIGSLVIRLGSPCILDISDGSCAHFRHVLGDEKVDVSCSESYFVCSYARFASYAIDVGGLSHHLQTRDNTPENPWRPNLTGLERTETHFLLPHSPNNRRTLRRTLSFSGS